MKTLPKKEQDIFLAKLLKDRKLREDLIDVAIAESRSKDKSRPFRDFLGTFSSRYQYRLKELGN